MTIQQKVIETEATGKAINEVIQENEGWQVMQMVLVGSNVIILFQKVMPGNEKQITDY